MTIWGRAKYGFAAALVVIMTVPALHVSAAGSLYAEWTLSGSVGNWSGTMTIPATGFPAATYAANSNTPQTPGGGSAFLGTDTPFGAVYGSSQNQPYLNMPPAPGLAPSTTTFTFDGPTPPGWGFALGDVDADMVTIQASGPGGPLSADQLGFQDAFNYCNSSPVPSTCGPGPHTDVPMWDAGTTSLVGNVVDTAGASGWFQPTVPVTSLTFVFTVQSGIPIYQIWMAAPTADVSGAVTVETPDGPIPAPPGTTVELRTPEGETLETVTVDDDGSYAFLEAAVTLFDVVVIPPDGYEVVGDDTLPADTTAGDVTDVDFILQQEPTPTTPPPTTSPPTTTPPTTSPPTTTPPSTPPTTPPASTVTPTTSPLPSTVPPTSDGEIAPATTTDETTVPPTTSTPGPPSATPPSGSLPSTGSSPTSALIVAAIATALGAAALLGLRLSSRRQ